MSSFISIQIVIIIFNIWCICLSFWVIGITIFHGLNIIKKKKAKFTKTEIDEVIINYIKNGGRIPTAAKELVSLGLPSRDAIMRYYRDWHEPFIIYSKLYEKLN